MGVALAGHGGVFVVSLLHQKMAQILLDSFFKKQP
jgi:hypothetical protein